MSKRRYRGDRTRMSIPRSVSRFKLQILKLNDIHCSLWTGPIAGNIAQFVNFLSTVPIVIVLVDRAAELAFTIVESRCGALSIVSPLHCGAYIERYRCPLLAERHCSCISSIDNIPNINTFLARYASCNRFPFGKKKKKMDV